MMFLINEKIVEKRKLEKGDAKGVWAKYLITEKDGAKKFQLRIFIVEPAGNTSYDQHIYEHEVYVLKGKGRLITVKDNNRNEVTVQEGDAILIESNEIHQFFNDSSEPLILLCIKGDPSIY